MGKYRSINSYRPVRDCLEHVPKPYTKLIYSVLCFVPACRSLKFTVFNREYQYQTALTFILKFV